MKTVGFLFIVFAVVCSWSSLFAQLTDSNLPIIKINTNGQGIASNPKIMADMKMYYHSDGSRNYLTDAASYSGRIGIEVRGNSSSGFEKLSYDIETWDFNGLSIDTSLLEMPKESDWILYASHNDKTFLRNAMTYQLYNDMGHYAARTKHCELILNDQYMGVYVFMEKIKRDNDRVDIAKLKQIDTSGVELTGGYILRIDSGLGFLSTVQNATGGFSIGFAHYYPNDYQITPQQDAYIQSYIDTFQQVLYGSNFSNVTNGFRKYADESSFIDYLLLEELAKNADIYVRSTLIVKPKDGEGKLQMGPPWDCDICYGNIVWIGAETTSGFYYNDTQLIRLSWEERMMQDPLYADHAKCRWMTLRQNELSLPRIHHYIDSMALYLNEAQQRNFARWPVLNQNVFINPMPYPQTYQEAIDSLKSYITQRLYWIDNHLPGACPDLEVAELLADQPLIHVFPNPSTADFYCTLSNTGMEVADIYVTDLTGNLVESFEPITLNAGENTLHIYPKKEWVSGVYLLHVGLNNKTYSVRLMR